MNDSTATDQSKKSPRPDRPEKPHADFPLHPHRSGSWVKKIGGKQYAFGGWKNDPTGEAALAKYNAQVEGLKAGIPQSELDSPSALDEIEDARKSWPGLTVKYLCEEFLKATDKRLNDTSNQITPRTASEYVGICDKLVEVLGENTPVADLRIQNFTALREELAKGKPDENGVRQQLGIVTLEGRIIRTKRVFSWAFKNGVIPNPINFGELYGRVSSRDKKRNRSLSGSKFVEPEELKRLIDNAAPELRAMILLAINTGFGNSDISNLTTEILDLEGGWIKHHSRGKTGEDRMSRLWPETVEAIREALKVRPKPADPKYNDRIFLSQVGLPLVRFKGTSNHNLVACRFKNLLKKLKIDRQGLAFYSLRHTFYTVASGCGDGHAVSFAMGHAIKGMGQAYFESRAALWDERLSKVADHVHDWLYPKNSTEDIEND